MRTRPGRDARPRRRPEDEGATESGTTAVPQGRGAAPSKRQCASPALENAPPESQYIAPQAVPEEGPVRGIPDSRPRPVRFALLKVPLLHVRLNDESGGAIRRLRSQRRVAGGHTATCSPEVVPAGQSRYSRNHAAIEGAGRGDDSFVLGSAPHPYPLVLGYYWSTRALRQPGARRSAASVSGLPPKAGWRHRSDPAATEQFQHGAKQVMNISDQQQHSPVAPVDASGRQLRRAARARAGRPADRAQNSRWSPPAPGWRALHCLLTKPGRAHPGAAGGSRLF